MCTITKNEQYNSFEVIFDGKPDEATRSTLKANGYRWHSLRRLWYGYKDIARELDSATTSREQTAQAEAERNADRAEQSKLLDRYIAEYLCGRKWATVDLVHKSVARIVELNNGDLLAIYKPKIKTSFCFCYGYNGVGTQEEYGNAHAAKEIADTQESCFIRKNLEQLTETIDLMDVYIKSQTEGYCGTVPLVPYLGYAGESIRTLRFLEKWRLKSMTAARRSNLREPTTDELNKIRSAYEKEVKAFEKRLQSYLKKYGLSKLRTWTYLSD